MTLRTLNYGNYGIFLIMGNAGFCPSAVPKPSAKGLHTLLQLSSLGFRLNDQVELVPRNLRTHILRLLGQRPYYIRLLGYFDAQGVTVEDSGMQVTGFGV